MSPWNYFTRSVDGKYGTCTIENCEANIMAKGGSTSGLHSHLRTQHKINLLKREDATESSTSIVKTPTNKITSFFKKITDDSFEAIVSRMVALDGLPFQKLINPSDLRTLH